MTVWGLASSGVYRIGKASIPQGGHRVLARPAGGLLPLGLAPTLAQWLGSRLVDPHERGDGRVREAAWLRRFTSKCCSPRSSAMR
jgi:hypothetical protein